jgi:hypothetical protein
MSGCPAWEYNTIANVNAVLAERARQALVIIRGKSPAEQEHLARETRPAHKVYFDGLTPHGYPHYAGNYRGQPLACLDAYEVHIQGDPNVGHTAATVPFEMEQRFGHEIDAIFGQLRMVWSASEQIFLPERKLHRSVELATAAFVDFLEIHPYANGNGHIGRLILICILARFGIFLARWPLHPRPPDPPYSSHIAQYRLGNKDQLVAFVLSCI